MNTQKQITLMVALVFLLLGGCAAYTVYDQPREDRSASAQQATLADRGGRIFARYCRQCHGNAGEGRIGPNLSRDELRDPAKRTETQQWVTDTVTCGRIGKIMPPWAIREGGALTDEQIRDLVTLITGAPPGSFLDSHNYWEQTAAEYSKEENIAVAKAAASNKASADALAAGATAAEAAAAGSKAAAETNDPADLQPIDEVLKGAAITGGGTTKVCGQLAPATPTEEASNGQLPAGLAPKDQWTEVTTDNKFSVTAIAVNAGTATTVTQDNQGKAIHNWEVLGADGKVLNGADGKKIATELTDGGKQASVSFTIATPGVYNFRCQVHPADMVGKLYVVGPDGTAGGGGVASGSPAASGTPSPPNSTAATPAPGSAPSGAQTNQPAGGGGGGVPNTTLTENMTDNKFSATTLSVPAGKPVQLTASNKGSAVHNFHVLNVKDDGGKDIKGDLLAAGKSQTLNFSISKPGTYDFQCDVHPTEMKGKLTVK